MAFFNAKNTHKVKLDVIDSWDNMETLNKMETHCKTCHDKF
jgi:cytochrome c556